MASSSHHHARTQSTSAATGFPWSSLSVHTTPVLNFASAATAAGSTPRSPLRGLNKDLLFAHRRPPPTISSPAHAKMDAQGGSLGSPAHYTPSHEVHNIFSRSGVATANKAAAAAATKPSRQTPRVFSHMDRLLQLMARHIPEHASRSAKIELEELYKRFSDLNGQVLLAKNRVHESTAELSAAKDTIAQLRTR